MWPGPTGAPVGEAKVICDNPESSGRERPTAAMPATSGRAADPVLDGSTRPEDCVGTKCSGCQRQSEAPDCGGVDG
ncbi:hypothetical protein PUN28_009821 [Cardiocondyla obscurior]|uniref:Uncharacterized protein n=1 Tax=Cardiocondyla obscurior TaxID=286306 RepID=A0AAW2FKF5_9HYME